MAASIPRKSAIRRSRSVCCLCVPQMNLTDAIPKPHSSSARLDDSMIDGSSASPR